MYVMNFDCTHLLLGFLIPLVLTMGPLHFILFKLPSLWFAIAASYGRRQPHLFILQVAAETIQLVLLTYKDGDCKPPQIIIQIKYFWAGMMAQQVKVLARQA